MSSLALPRARRPSPEALQLLVLVLGAAATWLLVRQFLSNNRAGVSVVVGVAAGLLLLARTRPLALVWLVLVASVFPARVLPFSAGGVQTDLAELLGLGLVAAVAARAAMGERPLLTPFTGPLLALVGAATIGSVVAIANGAERASWLALYKAILLYLVPVAFCFLFTTSEQRDTLERAIHRICTWGGLCVLLAAATGLSIPSGDLPNVVTLDVSSEALRLRPALLTLTILATLTLVAAVSTRQLRALDLYRFGIYGGVVAISFTRSTWVPLALALLLLLVLRPGRRTPLRGLKATMAVVIVTGALFPLASSGSLGATPQAITIRIMSIGSDRVLEENSFQDREIERVNAVAVIKDNPILGIGLGESYGAVRRVFDPVTGARSLVERRFIHNSFLGFWLWTGLAGIAALTWLGVRIVGAAAAAARHVDSREGTRAVAAALALFALGLQATFQTSMTSRPVIATLACALALLDFPSAARSLRSASAT